MANAQLTDYLERFDMSDSELNLESIEVLLESAHPSIQQYAARLETINAQLQKRTVEQKAEMVSQRNKIVALEKQRDELKAALENRGPGLKIVLNRPDDHNPDS